MDMTRITPRASALMTDTLLVDRADAYKLQPPTVVGYASRRARELMSKELKCLVQATSTDVVDGLADTAYSIKVPTGTNVSPGMLLVITQCAREPSLVGVELMVDSISEDGLSIIRKCIAHAYSTVDHQGA